MTRIIPGVQVTVVKEVVPPQLAPSGVLGLIGLTEKKLEETQRAASWGRFLEVCGPATGYSMPEARLALANGVYELVIVPMQSSTAAKASAAVPDSSFTLTAKLPDVKATVAGSGTKFDLTLSPKSGAPESYKDAQLTGLAETLKDSKLVSVDGISATAPQEGEYQLEKDVAVSIPQASAANLKLKLEARAAGNWANGYKVRVSHRAEKFDLELLSPDDKTVEVIRNLEAATVADVLEKASTVVRVDPAVTPSKPPVGQYTLAGGADASTTEYADALEPLKDEPDVDMVLAAVQDTSSDRLTKIYSDIISHCNVMSADSKGRIGFGNVPPDATAAEATQMANTLLSDRFVLLAPAGVVGAVAGRVGGLDYFQSPTFKTISGLTPLSRSIPLEEQGALLQGHVVPVVDQRGRGVIILRGLTTDGDQISVRRIADRAVRGVKMLGDLFIGRLNNEDGRGALKQKLMEFLVQMEREGALVRSTDGKDPAYKVDVHSSQDDFAMGVVRVDIAVRPVRAIDYIYATIFVQV